MRRRYHDMMITACARRAQNLAAWVDRLEQELDRERAYSRNLLERLAGVDDAMDARLIEYKDLELGITRQAKINLTPEQEGRPSWAEPEPGDWSPDGLSSSLDDDPTRLDDLPSWLPEDEAPHPEPLPESEGRERAVGIAPGENPFQGLVGLDPNA